MGGNCLSELVSLWQTSSESMVCTGGWWGSGGGGGGAGGLGGRLVSEFMARLVCARDAGCAGCPDASALVLSA